MAFKKPLEFTEPDLKEMERLYRAGMSTGKIGKRFNCLGGSVWRRLLDRGVEMRPQSLRTRRWSVTSHGYIRFGHNYLHRIVAAAWLGRDLLPGEVVHHIDGNKTNNHPDNLEVLPSHTAHVSTRHRAIWTPEKIARLRELVALGWTSKRIGVELGVTRNAVSVQRQHLRRPRPSRAKAAA